MNRGGDQIIPRPADVRPGRPAPWLHLAADERRVTLADARRRLAAAPAPRRSPAEAAGARASAVLAPLFEEGGEVWVLLTRRAQHMRSHHGEVSFPGGRHEGSETLWATALREAWEEVRLDPEGVERIGELDHLSTVTSRAFIVPFVGALAGRPTDLVPDPAEVEHILLVPFSRLLDDDVYREETWAWQGTERPISFFELEGDTIWGATAAMLRNLLCIVLHCRPDGAPADR